MEQDCWKPSQSFLVIVPLYRALFRLCIGRLGFNHGPHTFFGFPGSCAVTVSLNSHESSPKVLMSFSLMLVHRLYDCFAYNFQLQFISRTHAPDYRASTSVVFW